MSLKIFELLGYALDSEASDLHLSVGAIPMVRIHGIMKPLNLPLLSADQMDTILNDVMNESQKNRFEEKKEVDFSVELEDRGRFRVNFFRQLRGIAGVFRTIPSDIKSFDELGVPPALARLALKDRGLILLTGPTGSGKSTTLAAMVDHINEQKKSSYYYNRRPC